MRFRKTAAAQADRIDANVVVMNGATMKCFLLNDMAAVLWEALDHFPDREQLVSLLSDAEVADPARTVDTLTGDLLEAGLIEPYPV